MRVPVSRAVEASARRMAEIVQRQAGTLRAVTQAHSQAAEWLDHTRRLERELEGAGSVSVWLDRALRELGAVEEDLQATAAAIRRADEA